jgi:heme exporter protein A
LRKRRINGLKSYKPASVHSAAAQQSAERTVLQADGLAAFRGEFLVFRDLSFAVPAGGALLLAGPNGAGKSTLLRLLAGQAARVAFLGHRDAVKPGLTVAENLRFAARLGGFDAEAALAAMALEALAALPARMLSAGQSRRLALARVVLSPAPLWLLDEPTLGLDTASVARLGALLATHRDRGGVVVAATHLPLPLADAATLRLEGRARVGELVDES